MSGLSGGRSDNVTRLQSDKWGSLEGRKFWIIEVVADCGSRISDELVKILVNSMFQL